MKKVFFSHPYFNVDENAGGSTSDPQQNADSSESTAGSENSKPFAVFPDEQSFMSRVSREAKKQFGDLLKGLGVEKETDLKNIINSHKESIEKSKSELEKAQEAAAKAAQQRDEALSMAHNTLKRTEVKMQALGSGVKPERVDYLLKLIDLNQIEVNDGEVNRDAVKLSVEKLLTELPELRQTMIQAPKAGEDFNSGTKQSFLTLEAIKNMPVE